MLFLKKALITGITGQDGSYLTEFLLEKEYEVHGIIRRSSSQNTGRIDYLLNDKKYSDKIFLHYGDLTDSLNIVNLVKEIEPDEIYNLAAQSHVQISFETAEYTADVDGLGTFIEYEENDDIKHLSEQEKIDSMLNDLRSLGINFGSDYSCKKPYMKFKKENNSK